MSHGAAIAQTVALAWDPSPDTTVTGYVVSYGTAPGNYIGTADVGLQTHFDINTLGVGERYFFTVRAYTADRTMSDPTPEVSTVVASNYLRISNDFRSAGEVERSGAVAFDYDGDGRADIPLFRAATGQWFVLSGATRTPWATVTFGQDGDVPLTGDFDGDRKMDPAVYHPATGRWYILGSQSRYGAIQSYTWGYPTDTPLTADFDGDGRADLVIYRPSTGMWYVLQSSASYTRWITRKWGNDLTALPPGSSDLTPDRPIPADYDGDGRADFAVYRPSTGMWFVLPSATGYNNGWSVKWGIDTTALPADYSGDGNPDTPIPADYDGDGLAEITVYRNSTGLWYSLLSSSDFTEWTTLKWGSAGDVPIPADYNGDGVMDAAVFRPSTGQWYIHGQLTTTWGISTDTPLPRR